MIIKLKKSDHMGFFFFNLKLCMCQWSNPRMWTHFCCCFFFMTEDTHHNGPTSFCLTACWAALRSSKTHNWPSFGLGWVVPFAEVLQSSKALRVYHLPGRLSDWHGQEKIRRGLQEINLDWNFVLGEKQRDFRKFYIWPYRFTTMGRKRDARYQTKLGTLNWSPGFTLSLEEFQHDPGVMEGGVCLTVSQQV